MCCVCVSSSVDTLLPPNPHLIPSLRLRYEPSDSDAARLFTLTPASVNDSLLTNPRHPIHISDANISPETRSLIDYLDLGLGSDVYNSETQLILV